MNRDRARLDRVACVAWIASGVWHAILFVLLVSALLPRGQSREPLELEITVADPGAELVTLDVSIAEPAADQAARLTDLIGDLSAAPPEIQAPSAMLASSPRGQGRDQSTAGTRSGATGGAGRASFFGTQASGDRFVYVVDTSGSMNAGQGRRLQRAIAELLRSVEGLTPDQQFFVLLFSTKTRQLFDAHTPLPQLVPATAENKARLRRWVKSLRPSGGTHPQEALRIGIDLRPSAIFLLSDGRFSRSHGRKFLEGSQPEVRTLVARQDSGHVPIHTVAFEEPGARENLREISELTHGQFAYVPAEDHLLAGPDSSTNIARERRAANWLAIAKKLEWQSRPDMAQHYYAKVVQHFPDTPAAQEAARRRQDHLAMQPPADPGNSP